MISHSDFIRYGEEISEDLRLERFHQISKNIDVDSAQWFRNNLDWLQKNWIMDESIRKSYGDIELSVMTRPPGKNKDHLGQEMPISMSQPEIKTYQMQLFRVHRRISHGIHSNYRNYQSEMLKLKEAVIQEQIHNILRACVFGVYIKINPVITPTLRSMSGFIEQKGRLPRPEDQVTMAVLGGRFLQMHTMPDFGSEHEEFWLTTECCIIAH